MGRAVKTRYAPALSYLTERDFQICADVFDHRFLATTQIQQLHFDSYARARVRTKQLYDLGVLDRFRPPKRPVIGSLPFRDAVYEASHEPIIDLELFNSAKRFLQDRREALGTRRNNSTDYVLTPFLKCSKCGHGFIGTVSHGKGGAYRYYVCYSRRRHGTASCNQDWLPAEKLEEKIFEVVLAELADGSVFSEAAARAKREWEAKHAGAGPELKRLEAKVRQRREAIDRYLKSFEAGQLPESSAVTASERSRRKSQSSRPRSRHWSLVRDRPAVLLASWKT